MVTLFTVIFQLFTPLVISCEACGVYSYDVSGEPAITDANAMIAAHMNIRPFKPPCRGENA